MERMRVAPVAKLNAAPEFFTKVNCRKDPINLIGSRGSKLAIAQVLVAKSISQMTQAMK
jgi:hypothetical protein